MLPCRLWNYLLPWVRCCAKQGDMVEWAEAQSPHQHALKLHPWHFLPAAWGDGGKAGPGQLHQVCERGENFTLAVPVSLYLGISFVSGPCFVVFSHWWRHGSMERASIWVGKLLLRSPTIFSIAFTNALGMDVRLLSPQFFRSFLSPFFKD